MTTEYHHVPSTNRLLDKYETSSTTSSHNDIFNGDYINLTKHPKPISNSININTNKKSHFMNNSFDRGVFAVNGGGDNNKQAPSSRGQQQQEFELTERRSQSFKNRPRTNSTNDTIDTTANKRAYSPKKKLHQGNNSTSHDTIASSLKRIISAGKEKLSPSHILDTNNKEYIYRFKANRSLSNNSYTGGSVYAHDIDDDDDDEEDEREVEEEEMISDEDAQSERAKFLNENDKQQAPLDDAEKTSAEYGPLDSSGSSTSSSPTAATAATTNGGPSSNNLNRLNLIDTTTPNILIMDGKASLNSINNKSPSSKIVKRNDSIRMRHNSSNNLAAQARNSFSDVSSVKSGSKREKLRRALKKFNRAGSGVSQKRQNFIIVVILCIVNLLNYIDRFTLAGI